MKKVHFIAIGGSAMHNLAIALHNKGIEVTGSDDQIFEPSRTRLTDKGLIPAKDGWFPNKITNDLDAIILGMHARIDNPELLKAQELGVKMYSYPEFIYEQTKNKKRIVIGGSHGKTTITSMIIHVLNHLGFNYDFMVGAQLEGFDCMVKLSDDTDFVILEGDEYLSSPLDRRSKFFHYKPHVAVLTGVAWDHMNVFPTFENYVQQFSDFIKQIEPEGKLFWYKHDEVLQDICQADSAINQKSYEHLNYVLEDGVVYLLTDENKTAIELFGKHNMENLSAAFSVCRELGVSYTQFVEAVKGFSGASKRLEKFKNKEEKIVFRDFAHSPSKVQATVNAVKEMYAEKNVVAIFELHTYSSLNKEFLGNYKGVMNSADHKIVFYDPEAVKLKKLPFISKEDLVQSFDDDTIICCASTDELKTYLTTFSAQNDDVLLLMSSGNFGGTGLDELVSTVFN